MSERNLFPVVAFWRREVWSSFRAIVTLSLQGQPFPKGSLLGNPARCQLFCVNEIWLCSPFWRFLLCLKYAGCNLQRGSVFLLVPGFSDFPASQYDGVSLAGSPGPAQVPLSVWVSRLLNERWRSVLLFLFWWSGVLIVLPAIGICLDVLQSLFPIWFSSVFVQCIAFVVCLTLATLVVCSPVRFFRILLGIGGLCFLAFFALPVVATLVFLLRLQSTGGALPHPALTLLPGHFSWSLFGLALLNQIGVNAPLLLDGELRGKQPFLRRSTSYLWWAGYGALFMLLLATVFWVVVNAPLHIFQQRLFPFFGSILGQGSVILAGWLLFLGAFDSALAFLFLFSHAFLLAARQGYLPHALARLNRVGTPVRAILTQSVMILCTAILVLVVTPALLRALLPGSLLTELSTGDQFGLLAAIGGSLWCLLTALLFWKKGGFSWGNWGRCLILPGLCLSGCVTALVCAFAPLLPDLPTLFFSHTRWFPLILGGFACSLALAWMIGELPRRSAQKRAKTQSLAREKALREELQMVSLRQKELLEEVNRLYREQKQMAMTDQIAGLFTHRVFLERLEAEIARCQKEACSFLLLFLDLDHFKVINDTWGHRAGDAVLHEVARRLQNALRPEDVAGRYGGEEFTVILVNATIEEAHQEGERLRQLLGSAPCPWQCSDEQLIGICVTVSIGVAAYGIHGMQSKDVLERADQAMYQAKLAGRDGVRVAGESLPSVAPDNASPNESSSSSPDTSRAFP